MEDRALTMEAFAGEMVFKLILKEGVFRFNCSRNDGNAAFPSLSFVDPKAWETPIVVHDKVPSSSSPSEIY